MIFNSNFEKNYLVDTENNSLLGYTHSVLMPLNFYVILPRCWIVKFPRNTINYKRFISEPPSTR